jgi:thioredoxin-like negative regulator of GroEL
VAVVAGLAVLGAVTTGCGKRVEQEPTPVQSQWHIRNADQSHISHAIELGLPMVIKFGWDKCAPCREMEPVLDRLAEYYGGKVLVLTIDVYRQPVLAAKYGVQLIPKIVFARADGSVADYVEGYSSFEEMKSLVEASGIRK